VGLGHIHLVQVPGAIERGTHDRAAGVPLALVISDSDALGGGGGGGMACHSFRKLRLPRHGQNWENHHTQRLSSRKVLIQSLLAVMISLQCVFAYATRAHFIVACFEFTFRSYFRVCHCKIGRNTTVLAPGCRLETCTDSKPTSCKQEGQGLQRRCLPTAPSNKRQEKKTALQLR